jgi:hypothetical protein
MSSVLFNAQFRSHAEAVVKPLLYKTSFIYLAMFYLSHFISWFHKYAF